MLAVIRPFRPHRLTFRRRTRPYRADTAIAMPNFLPNKVSARGLTTAIAIVSHPPGRVVVVVVMRWWCSSFFESAPALRDPVVRFDFLTGPRVRVLRSRERSSFIL